MSSNAQRHCYPLDSPPPLTNLMPFRLKSNNAPKLHSRWSEPIPSLIPHRRLGNGAFGLVWEVTRPDIVNENGEEVKYAAKITRKPESQDKYSKQLAQEDEEWVRSEARIMRELSHPNVVATSRSALSQKDLLQRESQSIIHDVIRQLLNAVAHFDTNYTLHRDLKPGNLLFRTYSTSSRSSDSSSSSSSSSAKMKEGLVVGDFGNARRNERRKAHKLCGTIGYLAPEQSKGEYTTKVDMWSVGSKQSNGNAEDFEIVMTNEMVDGIFITSNLWKFCSEDAKNFVRKCLEVDPDKRMSAHKALSHPWLREYRRDTGNNVEIPIRSKQLWSKGLSSVQQKASEALQEKAKGTATSTDPRKVQAMSSKDNGKGGHKHRGTK
ncbi:kinase-like protein [Fomitiporia mediterranea MF3/22]|uniref:kinase-like protein n=1 Tax=Fomitiporia mediterranea (strain MF3/22) TaxID=694068 RepID=UPI0004409169|nr:kinase-like protein [Fomitiporia mediterranea MF3/22]EJD00332.1 kinase-like protein [Fomitiporia mediterranea MF3/22]